MDKRPMSPDELRRFADELESQRCTGVMAAWCPTHGECRCDKDTHDLSDSVCPLHAPGSAHAALVQTVERP